MAERLDDLLDYQAPLPTLQNLDLRLLRIFLAVVRNNGFTAAQTELNIGQSTISGYMSQLEARLGLKLCERGRGGFRLTDAGTRVHSSAESLFRHLDSFRTEVGEVRNELVGTFHLGMVDAIATMTDCPMWKALQTFVEAAPEINIEMKIESPQALVRGLLGGRYDAAIVPVFRPASGLVLAPLDQNNRQTLYCGKEHPFFDLADDAITKEMLEAVPYVARKHMEGWPMPGGVTYNAKAAASDMECLVALILSGRFIGHLAQDFARIWVAHGLMKPLLEQKLSFFSKIYLATRKREPTKAARLLMKCLREASSA